MRLLPLLFLLLLCTSVRAQKNRIDTLEGPIEGTITYQYITEMPAGTQMSKAERFMRGIRGSDPAPAWNQLDSIVIIDADTGEKLAEEVLENILKVEGGRPKYRPSRKAETWSDPNPSTLYSATNLVVLEGRIGDAFDHQVTISNASDRERSLNRTDKSTPLMTKANKLVVTPASETVLQVSGELPGGAKTYPLILEQGDSLRLEVRFSLNGHDINEKDFVDNPRLAGLPYWEVPQGREVLYLRLRSTEKLMTVYRNGKVYNKIAVGRQLDELSLIGLAPGEYLLEVIDLGTGKPRYHGLRR